MVALFCSFLFGILQIINLFNKVRDFVKESFNNDAQMLHFDRTVHWLKQLNPDVDEALLIAGIGHDIERAFKKERGKFEWMYDRISSSEAKELATPYYQKMMEDLELAREINY